MYRSHDSDRDSPHEVGIGPGVTCGLTNRAAPPALYLGSFEPRRNGLDALRHAADAGRRRFDLPVVRPWRLAPSPAGSAAPGAAARAVALLLQRLVGVRQFVGDH